MTDEIELPSLVVKTAKSEFRLRCHAAAWAREYGGSVQVHRRRSEDYPGLLLLSATGPDTAAKALRATLYQPDIRAEFSLDGKNVIKASLTFGGKPVTYGAAVTKLDRGVVHLVAVAKIPGLMPNMSDNHLWSELSGPNYTTPLLRTWIPWLKQAMTKDGNIILAAGHAATVAIRKTEPADLDALVSRGVKEGHLRLVA
jgi:hypothetical protein